jgi:hypothetical protein
MFFVHMGLLQIYPPTLSSITLRIDPDFDPTRHAFYYNRVIEIPAFRQTAYDAKRFGLGLSKELPMTTQQRACTSPI